MKATIRQLGIGHSFTASGTTYVKLRMQTQGNYGRINAQGPPQYRHDEGYRFFYEDQVVEVPQGTVLAEVIMSEKDQLVGLADALNATARQLAPLRDAFEHGTTEHGNLSKACELTLDTLGRVQDKLGR